MNGIPLICVAMLFASIIALQTTAPQNHIVYLPAADGVMKVKPIDAANANHKVLSLEEAIVRYEEKHGPIKNEEADYDYDESDCLLGNCALDVELMMAKYKLRKLLRG